MSAASTLLLISTDQDLIATVQGVATALPGLYLQVLAEAGQACARLERAPAALAVVHLPSGADPAVVPQLLGAVRTQRRPVPVLVLSDAHHPDQALALLRLGVADYLARPLDLNRLSYLLDFLTVRVRYETRPSASTQASVAAVAGTGVDDFLYDPSGGMDLLMEQVRRVAPQQTTVLLGGETGTGKTRLARLLHDLSPRRAHPFLVVNCGSLADNLIESELFGHVKGAFTGADRQRTGKCAEVGEGTLLLDDIDALPLALQVKLLRLVEERVFEPVGSNRVVPLRARLVAASNRRLGQEVAAGRFRQDLYYRLDVISFHLPPLRERRGLLPLLAERLVSEFAARNGRAVRGLAAEAVRLLQGHDWPGNIRELRNVIERAVALCAGPMVGPEDLPASLRPGEPAVLPGPVATLPEAVVLPVGSEVSGTLLQAKEQAEAQRISEALHRNKHNRLRTAEELGISRETLYKKLHRYGLMGLRSFTRDCAAAVDPGIL